MNKKLRLTNNYIKNMFDLMKFCFMDENQDAMYGTLKQEIQREMSYNVPLNEIMARINQYFIQNSIHYERGPKRASRSPRSKH